MPRKRVIGEVAVDYDIPLSVKIELGAYRFVDPLIASGHFPALKRGKASLIVEDFFLRNAAGMTMGQVRERMREARRMPLNLAELLALGLAFPELELRFGIIIALGSSFRIKPGNALPPGIYVPALKNVFGSPEARELKTVCVLPKIGRQTHFAVFER